ncbi:MAG: filamentous hemagglutinin N-terminal domain-containing protein [Halothece sp.]
MFNINCCKPLFVIPLLSSGLLIAQSAIAQITPDETLGDENSVVVPNQEIRGIDSDRIEGGAKRDRNLFHSFQEFNIESGRGAYLSNPEGIANILMRVTGQDISNINGTLGVLGDANLFFINPNGIVFGEGARLDVNGSFVGSTAESILFDNYEFSATNPDAPPLLTVDVPLGLQMNRQSGTIVNRSVAPNEEDDPMGLTFSPEQTLGLIGGEIRLEEGVVTGEAGSVELGSVTENSQVGFNFQDGLSFDYQEVMEFGNISLTGGGGIQAGGERPSNVNLQGRQIEILDSGTQISARNTGSQPGANMTLKASDSILMGTGNEAIQIDARGSGNAGDLIIETREFLMKNATLINAASFSEGRAADITIQAKDVLALSGKNSDDLPSAIQLGAVNSGDSGNIEIVTKDLLLKDGAFITNSNFGGAGDAGNLTVVASESVEIVGTFQQGRSSAGLFTQANPNSTAEAGEVNPSAGGDAGRIKVDTKRLTLREGAQISVSTLNLGNGGEMILNASESIKVLGGAFREDGSRVTSGIFSSVGRRNDAAINENATGQGGDITVSTEALTVRNAQLIATTFAKGDSGSITLDVAELSIEDGGQIGVGSRGEDATGSGGNLNVTTSGSLEIFGTGLDFTLLGETDPSPIDSTLFARSEGSGDAGNISVTAGDVIIDDRGNIVTSALGSGSGGDLELTVRSLSLDNGEITASTGLNGDAGNITLSANTLNVSNSQVLASSAADSTGNSGNIFLKGETINLENGGRIAVDSQGEQPGGNINLTANELNLTEGEVSAVTTNANGGNIDFDLGNLLLLQEESLISATAGTAQAEGDGGNIRLSSPFIVATFSDGPSGNDITANAFTGDGGNVFIETQGLFGIQFRDLTNPRENPTNDITVSSTFGASGQFQLEDLDTEPTSGLLNVPEIQVDVELEQGCDAGSGSLAFYNVGRAGTPRTPDSLFTSDAVLEEWSPLESEDNRADFEPSEANFSNQNFTPVLFVPACHQERN